MNTLVSYDWLKHYVDLKGVPVDEFARRVSLSGPGVEKIYPQGEALEKIVVGHVTKVEKHPNADKLKVAHVNVGGKHPANIVCGGSNLKEDQWVVVALVGSRVRWHGEDDLVTLEPAEIRGVKSEGMICASNEIGLADAFPGAEREILDLGLAIPDLKTKAGTSIADLLGLADDAVMDIEVTSNRVDAMGMVGMAREASAILGKKMLWKPTTLKKAKGSSVAVTVHDKKLCPRYMAVRLTGVKNGPSPWWLKRRLASAGLNSISALVDITNYVLLELAQPMHVFDVARLKQGAKGPEIHVRLARKGEKMKALDGKDYDLDDRSLIIADAEGPVAVAGVMGGERSGAYDDTTDIIFEAATFEPVSVRRTARRLNLYSDSQQRFEKGLSTEALPDALARAVELTLDICGGKVAGPVSDVRAAKYKPAEYSITIKEIDDRIGLKISQATQLKYLRDLGFKVSIKGGKTIHAVVPWWRDHDIESGQDLIEEIARIHGYGNITPVLPQGSGNAWTAVEFQWEDKLKDVAKGAGLTETYSYSFVSDDVYKKASFDPSVCVHIQNPLSSDFTFMRTSLLPSMLQTITENQERYRSQRLFEISNVYFPTGKKWTDLSDERLEFAAAYLGGNDVFKQAKGFIEHAFVELGLGELSWKRLAEEGGFWHAGRSVQAFKDGMLVATVGEVSSAILRNFKIEGRVAMIESPLKEVFAKASTARRYVPTPAFPESKRDLAIVVDQRTEFDDVVRAIRRVDSLVTKAEWLSTYTGKGMKEGQKSVAIHLEFSASDRTLTAEEVDALLGKITLKLKEEFKAEIR
jgi:phenylalanyl-tRNA synthetase beta chain